MKRTTLLFVLLAIIMAVFSGGCYYKAQVESSEIGLTLNDGVSISSIVGPGRYTNYGYYAELKKIDLTVKTIDWTDPDLVTSDKQPIGLSLAISYHRNSGKECIEQMFTTYNSELFNAERLETLVRSRIPNAAKNNTAKRTLDNMLFDRDTLAKDLTAEISTEFESICLVLDTVQVSNIAPDQAYMAKLQEKARVIQDREIAAEAVKTADENLKRTKAETEIELELARRKNLVNAEMSKVYDTSPEMFTLKRLELIAQIVAAAQPGNMMIFVPEGSDLSFINSTRGDVVPVVTNNPPAQQ